MGTSTNIQEIIEGCLLGDGFIEKRKPEHNGSFIYLSSPKEHVEFVQQYFKEYCSENYQNVKRRELYDKRTDKTYVNYYFKTKSLEIFSKMHDRFYINKTKIVPKDLVITNINTLFWYIGDGELEGRHGHLKLHTNSFQKIEVESLCEMLSDFNAKPSYKTKGQYIISIPRTKVNLFLNYIGKCPIQDYKHKWQQVPYKNKNIEVNGVNNYFDLYPSIQKDFQTGKYTIYQLHKKYNVPIKAIKNNFDINKISWQPINTKKRIIQFNLDGSLIKEWGSGQQIKNELNFNASGISECCRGIRKQYKNFIWQFKQ